MDQSKVNDDVGCVEGRDEEPSDDTSECDRATWKWHETREKHWAEKKKGQGAWRRALERKRQRERKARNESIFFCSCHGSGTLWEEKKRLNESNLLSSLLFDSRSVKLYRWCNWLSWNSLAQASPFCFLEENRNPSVTRLTPASILNLYYSFSESLMSSICDSKSRRRLRTHAANFLFNVWFYFRCDVNKTFGWKLRYICAAVKRRLEAQLTDIFGCDAQQLNFYPGFSCCCVLFVVGSLASCGAREGSEKIK